MGLSLASWAEMNYIGHCDIVRGEPSAPGFHLSSHDHVMSETF